MNSRCTQKRVVLFMFVCLVVLPEVILAVGDVDMDLADEFGVKRDDILNNKEWEVLQEVSLDSLAGFPLKKDTEFHSVIELDEKELLKQFKNQQKTTANPSSLSEYDVNIDIEELAGSLNLSELKNCSIPVNVENEFVIQNPGNENVLFSKESSLDGNALSEILQLAQSQVKNLVQNNLGSSDSQLPVDDTTVDEIFLNFDHLSSDIEFNGSKPTVLKESTTKSFSNDNIFMDFGDLFNADSFMQINSDPFHMSTKADSIKELHEPKTIGTDFNSEYLQMPAEFDGYDFHLKNLTKIGLKFENPRLSHEHPLKPVPFETSTIKQNGFLSLDSDATSSSPIIINSESQFDEESFSESFSELDDDDSLSVVHPQNFHQSTFNSALLFNFNLSQNMENPEINTVFSNFQNMQQNNENGQPRQKVAENTFDDFTYYNYDDSNSVSNSEQDFSATVQIPHFGSTQNNSHINDASAQFLQPNNQSSCNMSFANGNDYKLPTVYNGTSQNHTNNDGSYYEPVFSEIEYDETDIPSHKSDNNIRHSFSRIYVPKLRKHDKRHVQFSPKFHHNDMSNLSGEATVNLFGSDNNSNMQLTRSLNDSKEKTWEQVKNPSRDFFMQEPNYSAQVPTNDKQKSTDSKSKSSEVMTKNPVVLQEETQKNANDNKIENNQKSDLTNHLIDEVFNEIDDSELENSSVAMKLSKSLFFITIAFCIFI